jgi:hypothetical protein
MTTYAPSAPALHFLTSFVDPNASDHARTYWKPDKSKNEIGLLETLHRRSDNHLMHLLVSSRPAEELRHNFSGGNGDCICIDDDLFKLSKTHFALRHMEQRVDDHVMVDGQAVKSVMREHLPQLHQDDYYLLAYRDYSDWAVNAKELRSRVVRDSTFGPKYVEEWFAIRVGQNPGAFIPITQGQFLFGCEILDQQRHSATPAQIASKAINLFALNTDQFRSTASLERSSQASQQNPASQQQGGAHAAAVYIPPSPWDWTPTAIERRINHFLDQQYRAVGRLVVKGLLVGFCTYLFVQYVRRGTGLMTPNHNTGGGGALNARGVSRRHHRASGGRGGYVDDGGASGSAIGSVIRSVFITGPKDVFDFILGA